MDIEAVAQERQPTPPAQGLRWVRTCLEKSKDKAVDLGRSIKKLGQDDPRRVIHSLKVGLAFTLVSLLYYVRPFYDSFGISGIWALMTVNFVFEFTVGATISKGLNRGFATFSAGALGVGAQHLACLFGEVGEPVVLGFLVFLLVGAATFTRFFPRIKARYDYGVLIFILTFSMVSVSGYRVEKLLELAQERLSTIVIGGATCIIVSIFLCPVWAGEDLHKLIFMHLEKLAVFLEGFGSEYFQSVNEDKAVISTGEKTFRLGYKSILTSNNMEESLANFARWEPGHGRFRFGHPWKQYLKIGALTRQCTYQIEALNGYLNSDLQAPPAFKKRIQEPCMKITLESSKALRMLGSDIKLMTEPSLASLHLCNSKVAVDNLKILLKTTSLEDAELLSIVPAATVASVLIQVVKHIEEIYEAVDELSRLANFKSAVKPKVSPEKPQAQSLLHRGVVKPIIDVGGDNGDVIVTVLDDKIPENENDSRAHNPNQHVEIVDIDRG
ncbi:aluminum-activated malate transporter 8-like [Rhodamnia argentea]|uniref:Aluminum-activated malate transporter 8-like n=1 Tax=Rhodamnia argentea TaxID=178133 RepID=A0A8B8PAQ9_9MYRT|nr:aluminum-activated malate transporter 8-like [Rhodamnia argentea]